MQANELNQRILELLAEERASHGHGSAADIDRQVGRSEGYLGRVLRGEVGLQTEMLFRILEVLELEPANFFSAAVGLKLDPETGLKRLSRRLAETSEQPSIQVGEDFLQRLEHLTAQCRSGVGSEKSDETWPRQRLRELDELRFSDPEAAIKPMADLLPQILKRLEASPEDETLRGDLIAGLGVAASIERVGGCLKHAVNYLLSALRWVEDRSSVAFAEILERACYLMGDEGDYDTAVQLTVQASQIYLRQCDLGGVGGCLVDRAVMLFKTHQPEETVRWYLAALRYLPHSDWRNRFAAFQGLGMSYLNMNKVEDAEEMALAASTVHATRYGLNWWRLVWLRAEIAYRRGDVEASEALFNQAKDAFATSGHPFDVALISLQLARVLLSANKVAEMQRLAASSMALLRPLRRHRLACAALQEFTRLTLTGELSVRWIESASRRLEARYPDGRNTPRAA